MVTMLAGRTTLDTCFSMLKGRVKLVNDQNKLYTALAMKQDLIYSLSLFSSSFSFFLFFLNCFQPTSVPWSGSLYGCLNSCSGVKLQVETAATLKQDCIFQRQCKLLLT